MDAGDWVTVAAVVVVSLGVAWDVYCGRRRKKKRREAVIAAYMKDFKEKEEDK